MNDVYKYCEHCGERIAANAQICPKCGYACEVSWQRGGDYERTDQEDVPSGGMNALAFFVPLVGIILYFVTKNETPVKAASMLKFAIIGICVWVGLTILINVLRYVIWVSTWNSIWDSTLDSVNRYYGY